MPRLPDETVSAIARDLAAVLDARAPDWTSHQTHDPGITVLEVMAFLADVLIYRQTSGAEKQHATDVIARLNTLAAGCVAPTIARVRYFEGRLLTASDFSDEQQYHRRKLALALLALHGAGIVNGLEVQTGDDGNGADVNVSVSAGSAITPGGELLVVDACRHCRLQVDGDAGFVFLTYTERETKPVPALDDTLRAQATRIEEGVAISFGVSAPSDAVIIGRLVRTASGWRLDGSFVPVRT